MHDSQHANMPWVLFLLNSQMFAVSAESVLEMAVMPKAYALPESPGYVRGVINLRDQVIPLIDLRARMGMQTLAAELEALKDVLEDRKQDHIDWIAELKRCVDAKCNFELTTNPHQCAFGRWYDKYVANSQALSFYLKKFDEPHRRIHAVALEVKAHQDAGRMDAAQAVVKRAQDHELREMIRLFAGFGEVLQETSREIALILSVNGIRVAASVDAVESVGRLADFEKIGLGGEADFPAHTGFVTMVAKRTDKGGIVQILNTARILEVAA